MLLREDFRDMRFNVEITCSDPRDMMKSGEARSWINSFTGTGPQVARLLTGVAGEYMGYGGWTSWLQRRLTSIDFEPVDEHHLPETIAVSIRRIR